MLREGLGVVWRCAGGGLLSGRVDMPLVGEGSSARGVLISHNLIQQETPLYEVITFMWSFLQVYNNDGARPCQSGQECIGGYHIIPDMLTMIFNL